MTAAGTHGEPGAAGVGANGADANGADASSRTGTRSNPWLIPILDALLEGAWIAVVDAAFAASGGTRALGPLPFAALALASLVWTRSAPDRRTAYLGLGALYVVGFIGVGFVGGGAIGDPVPAQRQSLFAGFAEASAVLAAIAVFRGSRHIDPTEDDLTVNTVLQVGFPLLALPWLFATTLPAGQRSTFVETAFPSTLLFATAGLFALGLSRLDALSASSGLDWRRNRSWLLLLVGVLAVMAIIAVPSSLLLGTPIVTIIGGILGPLTLILTPIAEVLRQVLTFLLSFLNPLIDFLRSLAAQHPPPQIVDAGNPFGSLPPKPPSQGEETDSTGAILVAIALLSVAVVVLIVVVRMTFTRQAPRRPFDGEPLEEREYRLPALALHLPRRTRSPRRPGAPTTASEAYVGFLALLEGRPDLVRRASEPPATHAARLRAAGFRDPRAAFLAADYELEHYALRTLPARETRRALGRYERLRQLIRTLPRTTPDSAGSDAP